MGSGCLNWWEEHHGCTTVVYISFFGSKFNRWCYFIFPNTLNFDKHFYCHFLPFGKVTATLCLQHIIKNCSAFPRGISSNCPSYLYTRVTISPLYSTCLFTFPRTIFAPFLVKQAPMPSFSCPHAETGPQMLSSNVPCSLPSVILPLYTWPFLFHKGSRLNVVEDLGSFTAQLSPSTFCIAQAASVFHSNLNVQPIVPINEGGVPCEEITWMLQVSHCVNGWVCEMNFPHPNHFLIYIVPITPMSEAYWIITSHWNNNIFPSATKRNNQ